MSWVRFVHKNAWRKPVRTVLLMICIGVAFLIYGLTASFLAGSQGAAGASDDILGVMSAAGQGQPLPISAMSRISADPDVDVVTYSTRLRGFVGKEKNVVAVSATDPRALLAVYGKELGLTQDLVDAVDEAGDKVLVGRSLAEAQGWTVGQHVNVTAFQIMKSDGERDWRFEIAGIFEGATASTDTYFMIGHYDYLNAARSRDRDTADTFLVRPRPGVTANQLAARIDMSFANSAMPTRTQSEKQFLEGFLRQYADVGLIVDLVVSASFVTLLMIVANTMIFAVRERTFELGVLKTLGFSRRRILILILAETLFIFVVGGGCGLILATLASDMAGPSLGLVFSPLVWGRAAILILALGLLTGALPAFNAFRMPIIKAFRTR